MGVLVIGSFMMDCVTQAPRAPQAGETLIGTAYRTIPGGKGANQAVAARRLGSDVIMAGCLGEDAFGQTFVETFKQEGIDIKHVRFSQTHTGIGSILLEDNGENRIVVIPGANMAYTVADLQSLDEAIKQANVVMMQLEMRLDVVDTASQLCEQHSTPLILNPAPAQALSHKLLARVDYLTPNESELARLVGRSHLENLEEKCIAAQTLIALGVRRVIVTLGAEGCLLVDAQQTLHVPGHSVTVVDTVAAGDAFNGALAYGIDRGMPLEKTLALANAVGALTVQKHGAIPSLPTLDAVYSFCKSKSCT
ncbi:MAG: ribokinase [Acholeplasmatales bacterium]|nr:MAG: ribokinase [Acholeplasmatales bacterium]